jgi:hypothetical protein
MNYKADENLRIMESSYINRKYSKSTSLNLNCAVKNLTLVSLDKHLLASNLQL